MIAKVILGLALAGIVWAVLKRVFSGLFSGIGSLWGGGLTDEQEQLVASRKAPGLIRTVLYDRSDVEAFADASDADNAAIGERLGHLSALATAIHDAPGFLNDNEDVLVAAFNDLRSKYEAFWLNRLFVATPVDAFMLANFPPALGVPELGTFVDAFAQPADWLTIIQHLSRLPKYA